MHLRKAVVIALSGLLVAGSFACREETPAEKLGRQLDEAAQDAGEAFEDAGEAVGEAVEEAAEEAKKKLQ